MPDDAEAFVRKWSRFTEDDPRREEILRRVSTIYACLEPVLSDSDARAGEKVRAGEALLKATETFARSVRVDMKDSTEGRSLDTWGALLNFVREFHENYAQAENALRHKDEEGFAEYKRRYADFLREQSASGSLAPGSLVE